MNQEQINKIIDSLSQDRSIIQIVNERRLFLNNEPAAISTLVETIRKTHGNVYADLSVDMMSQLIASTKEQFGSDIATITLDDWKDDNTIHRLIDLHEYVRVYLANMLHKKSRQISWSVVGKIISAVFGNVPVITKGVRKALKEAHLLQYQHTDDIHQLLLSIQRVWLRYRDDIKQIIGALIINGAFQLGMGQTPQEIATILIPILLTKIFEAIHNTSHKDGTRHNNYKK